MMMKTIDDDDDDDDESWREGHKATSVVYEASTKQMKPPRVAKCCKICILFKKMAGKKNILMLVEVCFNICCA